MLYHITLTLSDVSMRSQTLRYHGLSHIASASWGCYALYGARCRSLSFSLLIVAALVLTKLDFGNATLGRHSVVSTGPPARGHECSGSTYLLDRSLELSSRQVAMIISLRYSAACTGFVYRSAYPWYHLIYWNNYILPLFIPKLIMQLSCTWTNVTLILITYVNWIIRFWEYCKINTFFSCSRAIHEL